MRVWPEISLFRVRYIEVSALDYVRFREIPLYIFSSLTSSQNLAAHDCLNFPSPPFFFMSKQKRHVLQLSREQPSHALHRTRLITVFSRAAFAVAYRLGVLFFVDLIFSSSSCSFAFFILSVWTRMRRARFTGGLTDSFLSSAELACLIGEFFVVVFGGVEGWVWSMTSLLISCTSLFDISPFCKNRIERNDNCRSKYKLTCHKIWIELSGESLYLDNYANC